jgi:hypothetical protein
MLKNWNVFSSRAGVCLLLTTASRSALGSTPHPIQRLLGFPFCGRNLKLATHVYITEANTYNAVVTFPRIIS